MAISVGHCHSMDNPTKPSFTRKTAIARGPHDPQQVIFHGGLAAAHYLAGSYDEAINSALSVLRFRPTFNGARRLLVAALAQAGRLDEAQIELAQLQTFQPD